MLVGIVAIEGWSLPIRHGEMQPWSTKWRPWFGCVSTDSYSALASLRVTLGEPLKGSTQQLKIFIRPLSSISLRVVYGRWTSRLLLYWTGTWKDESLNGIATNLRILIPILIVGGLKSVRWLAVAVGNIGEIRLFSILRLSFNFHFVGSRAQPKEPWKSSQVRSSSIIRMLWLYDWRFGADPDRNWDTCHLANLMFEWRAMP